MKRYFLNFIEEDIQNPKFEEYIGGRIEIIESGNQYPDEEIRFLTRNIIDFENFREEYDFKEVDFDTLEAIKEFVKNNFYEA